MEVTAEARRQAIAEFRDHAARGTWTWDEAVAFLYALSERGLTRRDLFEMCRDVLDNPPPGMTEHSEDLVTDLAGHLLGQCSVDQIIRLHGDPPGVEALAVYVTKKSWLKD